jgi:uncharacterized protein (TIGR04255 family)
MAVVELSRIKYANNFLSDVIFRLDFSPMLVISESISPKFQEQVRSLLPLLSEQKIVEYAAKIEAGQIEGSSKPLSNWILEDADHRFRLTLNYAYLAVEDLKYRTLDSFVGIIQPILEAFKSSYTNPHFTRLGLRYVNAIKFSEGNPFEWKDLVAEPLVCPIEGFVGSKQELSRAMSQFVLNKDDSTLIFNFGIFNPEYPSRIASREYILDYDCFSQDVDADPIRQIRNFNVHVLDLFEKSIQEPLRRIMEAAL